MIFKYENALKHMQSQTKIRRGNCASFTAIQNAFALEAKNKKICINIYTYNVN
jgi:hypothetical protein